MQSLTDANGRQHPDSGIWWVALWEERLDRVDGEGERHDGDRRRPHHNALHPETHEGQKPPKGDHDVRVVSSWTKKLSLQIELPDFQRQNLSS